MDDHTVDTPKNIENYNWQKLCGILCAKCNRIYTKKINYTNHYTKKHPGEDIIFTCTLCFKGIENYEKFRNHTYRHMIADRYKCELCPKLFSQKCHLNEHIEASHKNPLICKICEKSFNTTSNLNRHVRDTHNKKQYRCDECGKTLRNISTLQIHISTHKLGKYYMCDLCGTKFSRKTNLRTHIKIHDNPLLCQFCQKPFYGTNHLNEHLASHSDIKSYECKICNKFYKSVNYLNKHMKNHKDEKKPLLCKICDKRFTRMSKLKDHMNFHMGEKPYKCKYCDMTFTNNPNCLKHIRNRHKLATDSKPNASGESENVALQDLGNLENNNGTDIDRENIIYNPVNFAIVNPNVDQNTYVCNESVTDNNFAEESLTSPLQFYQNNESYKFVENYTNTQTYPSIPADLLDFENAGNLFCASENPGITYNDLNINTSSQYDTTQESMFQPENVITDNLESKLIEDLLPLYCTEFDSQKSLNVLSCEEILNALEFTEAGGISEMQMIDPKRIML